MHLADGLNQKTSALALIRTDLKHPARTQVFENLGPDRSGADKPSVCEFKISFLGFIAKGNHQVTQSIENKI
jgi:hypothetical protein